MMRPFGSQRIWRINRILLELRTFHSKPCIHISKLSSISSLKHVHQITSSTQNCKRSVSLSSVHYGKVVPFNLSDIGEGIGEVTIKEWYVSPGQKVSQFDSICEVQSDKASVTITSKFDGVIKKLYYAVDDTAKVGLPLVDIQLLDSGQVDVKDRDEINDQDASSETSISTQSNHVDQTLFHAHEGHGEHRHVYKKSLATPAVRRLAMENNIDLNLVKGSGKDGRIMKEDILQYIDQGLGSTSAQLPPLPQKFQMELKEADILSRTPAAKSVSKPVQATNLRNIHQPVDKKAPLNAVQKVMLKTMTESLKIPHLSLADDVIMSSLVSLKSSVFPGISKDTGISLTFLPFFIKAASMALSDFPMLNSCLDSDQSSLIYKGSHNIGFAMDTAAGLVVPNVKDVQGKSILEIGQEVKRLQDEGRSSGLNPNDLTGGTFTLSNIGSIGGVFGVPVILPPQVAIGALGRIRVVPDFDKEDKVVKSHVLRVVWSADHRVIDGATITRFSNRFKDLLEEPAKMLIYLK